MTWEQAFKKIVQDYFNNMEEEDTSAMGKLGKPKYDRKYFEGVEEEYFGSKDKVKKNGK
jgi:hypothetical protein